MTDDQTPNEPEAAEPTQAVPSHEPTTVMRSVGANAATSSEKSGWQRFRAWPAGAQFATWLAIFLAVIVIGAFAVVLTTSGEGSHNKKKEVVTSTTKKKSTTTSSRVTTSTTEASTSTSTSTTEPPTSTTSGSITTDVTLAPGAANNNY